LDSANIVAGDEAEGQRLDRFLCDRARTLGRAAARRLIEAGLVHVNGRAAAPGQRLHTGDRVEVAELPDSDAAVPDAGVSLRVLYEDAWLVVVDKPAGVASHPLRPGERGTLASGLLARYPEMAGVGYAAREPGLVHRLDTNTSGLVLAARDAQTFAALRALLEQGGIDKRYLALCTGGLAAPAVLEGWLSAQGKRVTVREQPFASARRVQTEVLSARAIGAWSLCELRVHVARRHQIRAQLAAAGHPIAGDVAYGGAALPGLARHFLHANALRLTHPGTGRALQVEAELPDELRALLADAERAAARG
jgi:23S rRNA pseudouridine1911/1915/1917 synthase